MARTEELATAIDPPKTSTDPPKTYWIDVTYLVEIALESSRADDSLFVNGRNRD